MGVDVTTYFMEHQRTLAIETILQQSAESNMYLQSVHILMDSCILSVSMIESMRICCLK